MELRVRLRYKSTSDFGKGDHLNFDKSLAHALEWLYDEDQFEDERTWLYWEDQRDRSLIHLKIKDLSHDCEPRKNSIQQQPLPQSLPTRPSAES